MTGFHQMQAVDSSADSKHFVSQCDSGVQPLPIDVVACEGSKRPRSESKNPVVNIDDDMENCPPMMDFIGLDD
jgi:hypothetical protein